MKKHNNKKTEQRQPTTEKLAQALTEANAPQHMIDRAKEGWYDDYKSPLGDNIRALAQDANRWNLPDIAERAKNSEFDGQKWEAEQWRNSPEGRATFAEFGHLFK